MPARFVEVVDVSAEASSTIATLLARGSGLVGQLSFGLGDYLETNASAALLWKTLASYNVSVDALPRDLSDALRAAGADIAFSEDYVPGGRARAYILTGLTLVVTRELYVRWRVKQLLRERGFKCWASSANRNLSEAQLASETGTPHDAVVTQIL